MSRCSCLKDQGFLSIVCQILSLLIRQNRRRNLLKLSGFIPRKVSDKVICLALNSSIDRTLIIWSSYKIMSFERIEFYVFSLEPLIAVLNNGFLLMLILTFYANIAIRWHSPYSSAIVALLSIKLILSIPNKLKKNPLLRMRWSLQSTSSIF